MNQPKNTSNPIQLLTLSFDLPLHRKELPNWRGAFNEMAKSANNELFHNHSNNAPDSKTKQSHTVSGGYHYRHPLIQYRVHHKKAAVLAINQGIDAMHEVLANHEWQLRWRNEPRTLKVEDVKITTDTFRLLPAPTTYRIRRWIALNQPNYEKWQQCQSLIQRAALLERILAAQLLALFTAFDWRIPARLEVHLQDIHSEFPISAHKTSMLSFDVSFTANVHIPVGLAIGRSISFGYGEVWKG